MIETYNQSTQLLKDKLVSMEKAILVEEQVHATTKLQV